LNNELNNQLNLIQKFKINKSINIKLKIQKNIQIKMKYPILVIAIVALISSVSAEGRCGPNYGKCPEGTCCSSWGWCGIFDEHCLLSHGCQPQYGTCKGSGNGDTGDEPYSTDGRCGAGVGKCPAGTCCSKWGSCGIFDDHCLISKGCQPKYGVCKQGGEEHHDDDHDKPDDDDDDDDHDEPDDDDDDDEPEPDDDDVPEPDDDKDDEPEPEPDDDDEDDDDDDDDADDDDDDW